MQEFKQEKLIKAHRLDFTYEDYINNGYSISNLIIDKYIIYTVIGKGSCGNVYQGFDDESKKQVAVKVIDLLSIQKQRPLLRKIRKRLAESQPELMKMCDSPHLIKCLDVYENQHLKILILEYCNGKTLQQEIDEKGFIPEDQAIVILRHIINGLAELHKHKIVHRDLKSENIMSHNGTYKIIDFGFSKKLEIFNYEAEINLTALGTRTTMAPEVFSKKPYGLKADIWSLGIIFFEMIYGRVPYNSSNATDFYHEISTKKYFYQENPLMFNNITPSKQVYKFLCDVIQVQTSKRLDWKQLVNHPLIANIQGGQLNQRFIEQVSVIDPKLNCDEMVPEQNLFAKDIDKSKIDESINNQELDNVEKKEHKNTQTETNIVKENIQKLNLHIDKSPDFKVDSNQKTAVLKTEKISETVKSKFKLDINFNINENEQKNECIPKKDDKSIEKVKNMENNGKKTNVFPMKRVPVMKISEKELDNKIKEIKKHKEDEEEQFNWTQEIHLECLKTEMIYKDLIKQIEEQQLLNLDDRVCIEYMYLLSARCFNNMSPIKNRLQNTNQRQPIIENLDKQVSILYKQISENFVKYSTKLTEIQNRTKSMIIDFFSRNIYRKEYKIKDKFLTGVQIVDYDKEQQIDFTGKNYTDKICQSLEKKSNYTNVQKYILAYAKICSVSLKQLTNLTFQRYAEKLIG